MLKSLAAGLAVLCMAAFAACGSPRAAAPPKVVVTIAPIHSLVAAIAAGVCEPQLLMPSGSSPHSFALKPSQARALRQADVIVRVGSTLETFLDRPLAALGKDASVVTLDEIGGIGLLEMRAGGVWEAHGDGREDDGDHRPGGEVGGPDHTGPDHAGHNPHIWLDPRNAVVAVDYIAGVLARVDPANAATYRTNARGLVARLNALDMELAAATAPIRAKPYVVFHDAYAYFEDRYGLSPAGAVTVSPDRAPGARRLGELRRKIITLGAVCVFSEPQFEPRLVAPIIEGTPARSAVLDPLGATLAPGPELYFTLIRNLAAALESCLGRS